MGYMNNSFDNLMGLTMQQNQFRQPFDQTNYNYANSYYPQPNQNPFYNSYATYTPYPAVPQSPAMNYYPINQQQFTQGVQGLSEQSIQSLIQQARAQGISEPEIQSGLNFLMRLK